jgi:hypothetical protein
MVSDSVLRLASLPPYWSIYLEVWLEKEVRVCRRLVTFASSREDAEQLAAALTQSYAPEIEAAQAEGRKARFKVYTGGRVETIGSYSGILL